MWYRKIFTLSAMLRGWVAQPRFALTLQGTESWNWRNFSMATSAEFFGKLKWWDSTWIRFPRSPFWLWRSFRTSVKMNQKFEETQQQTMQINTWAAENNSPSLSWSLLMPAKFSEKFDGSFQAPNGNPVPQNQVLAFSFPTIALWRRESWWEANSSFPPYL